MNLLRNAPAYIVSMFSTFTNKYCINAPLSNEPVADCMRAMRIDRASAYYTATCLFTIIFLSWRPNTNLYNITRCFLTVSAYLVGLFLLLVMLFENDILEEHRQVELPGGSAGEIEAVVAHARAMLLGSINLLPWFLIHLIACPWILWLAVAPLRR
ncbi:hypothetical protein M419DRAFT_25066 [Trichoderma reesei RUT C-30]|uniref:Uncharacterized protein n=1 Tax=Hypocrea jecorina (strain ATCC 56765 / BCRC 32924 / NRRL 11460 / Rut C-30) TaxID=1344414 RepID=A0A024S9A0_HYPJR|nr:hypothetical protein M419DRAFT_25066 [Trichoderma reesei RUT C-30]